MIMNTNVIFKKQKDVLECGQEYKLDVSFYEQY